MRRRRHPRHDGPGRHDAPTHDSRLPRQDRAVPDHGVIRDADLPGERDPFSEPGRAGDSRLRAKNRVLPDLHVVSDHHEVVDLGPPAHDRLSQRGAVDRRVGPHLNLVLEARDADLGNLAVTLPVPDISEAVRADHGARRQRPVARPTALENRCPGAKNAVLAQDGVLPDEGARPENRPGTNAGPRRNGRSCRDRHAAAELGGLVHGGTPRHSRFRPRWRRPGCKPRRQGCRGVGRHDGPAARVVEFRHEQSARRRTTRLPGAVLVGDPGQVGGPRRVECADAGQPQGRIPGGGAADCSGDIRQRERGSRHGRGNGAAPDGRRLPRCPLLHAAFARAQLPAGFFVVAALGAAGAVFGAASAFDSGTLMVVLNRLRTSSVTSTLSSA